MFYVAMAGENDMKSAGVVESLAKNTRKRMSNISAVNSPAKETRGKKGRK